MTENRFKDLCISNIAIASIGIIFYGIYPRVHFLFVALGVIIFLNFGSWLDTLEK